MLRKLSAFILCFILLVFPHASRAAVLPEQELSGCYPVIQNDSYDPRYPVPFPESGIDQPKDMLEIWFGRLSVCDGFIVRCNGETMLIDGSDFDHGRFTLLFLEALGITGVDYIFNTHHHADHLGMQVYLMNHGFKAREFLTPYDRDYPVTLQLQAQEAVDSNGIIYHTIHDGDEIRLGGENGALLQFFRWAGSTNANFASMMCKITYGNRSVFLMADVISKAQQALAVERPDIPWKSDIMKVGHHGYTPQETALLKMIDPEICVITNSYMGGIKTRQQLERMHIPFLITNQGTIYMHTDGGENWFCLQDKSHQK